MNYLLQFLALFSVRLCFRHILLFIKLYTMGTGYVNWPVPVFDPLFI